MTINRPEFIEGAGLVAGSVGVVPVRLRRIRRRRPQKPRQ